MLRPRDRPAGRRRPVAPIFEHTRGLGEKDLDLALALADELGVELPLAAEARRSLADGLGVPHGGDSGAAR